MTPFFPAEASGYAGDVDLLLVAFTVMMIALSAPVFIVMAIFAVKYRRGRPADRRHPVDQSIGLETSWAVVPFVLLLGFYVWATWLFVDLHRNPPGALEIDVVAKQWMWKFQHPGGQREINTLHVPVGQAVTLTMASQDVIHSLFIPALRIKQDVVPGRYTTLSFTADRPGTWRLACAEFCGTDHSLMAGSFVALTPADYAAWLRESSTDMTLAAAGEALFRTHGCSGCHGSAATVHAPPLEGLYGAPVPLEGGTIVRADKEYIRDSILLPQKQVAAGYPPIMPTFANQLGEEEVQELVAYIQSLATTAPEPRP
jgi:cytochrome c oxidase subunit 2